MNKPFEIYLVSSGELEDYRAWAAFSTRELAMEYIVKRGINKRESYRIETWLVDEHRRKLEEEAGLWPQK